MIVGMSQDRIPYDQWLRAEIARAEAKAEAMRAALEEYLGGRRSAPAITDRATVAERPPLPAKRKRTSKYEPVFAAFAKAGRPLGLDEMIETAKSVGMDIERDNLRSLVWTNKNAGRAIEQNGRYLWKISLDANAAPAEREDAA